MQAYSAIGKNPLALSSLIQNWKATPIVSIKTQDNPPCSSGYTEMITRRWPGTREGCDCNGEITVKGGSCGKGCNTIKAQKPVHITNFFGKTLCVKRSGSNIMKAVRPQEDDRTQCTDTNYKP